MTPPKPPSDRNDDSPGHRGRPDPPTQLPLKLPRPSPRSEPSRRGGWQAPQTKPAATERPASAAAGSSATADAKPVQPLAPTPTPTARPTPPVPPAADLTSRHAARVGRRGGFRVPSSRRHPTLISRAEHILFWTLLASVLAMSIFLVRYRERVTEHFAERAAIPLASASATSVNSRLTLYLANDLSGSLMQRDLDFPLPQDPNTRARVVLQTLLSDYTAPDSPHPLKPLAPGVPAVDEVFLLPIPGQPRSQARNQAQLAVVDLTSNFLRRHPSGIEPEMLTLLSMIATLHANLPRVAQVRFLVDGEPRATLAGHADLTQTYLAGSAQMTPLHPLTPREASSIPGITP
jgi:hypothetical protein